MENNASFEEILRLGAETPKINRSPLPKYCMADQSYGMTIGVAVTKKGRIFVCWVGGGDSSDAYFLLAYSDDHGMTFSEPCLGSIRTVTICLTSAVRSSARFLSIPITDFFSFSINPWSISTGKAQTG